MILPIVKEPNPLLHRAATPVRALTPELKQLIRDMIDTMHAAEGVGLAANQVGRPENILVASPNGPKGEALVLLNAVVIRKAGKETSAEGCLSIPGVTTQVTRAAEVTVRGQDAAGLSCTLKATGLLAKILQHEIDHLSGHLYPDRLPEQEQRKLLEKYAKLRATLSRIKL
jgi:peptide deformylase